MANTLRIKRTTTSNRPSSLANAELAYIEGSDLLVIGKGTGGAGGSATSIVDVGGLGMANNDAAKILMNGTQAAGTENTWARANHVHPTDTSRAPLASPTFTGVPAAPTALADTNTLQLATTAFVLGQAYTSTPAALGTAGAGSSTRFAKGDHVHAMPRLDQVLNPTAAVSLNSQKITNLADPVNAQDAATKAYVDAARSGLDVKASVRAASTANVTVTYTATGGVSARGQITAAPNTLDGVTLAANDRILLKDQSTGAQNGVWVVTTVGTGATGVWDRATDFDSDAEVTAGSFTFVTEGTANSDSGWVLTTNDVITIGGASGTALAFAQFSGAGQIIAGAGLSKNGNTLSLATTGTAGTYRSVTTDAYGRVTSGSNPTTLSGYGITDAQPLDSDLTAVAALSSTGFAVRTGANTWALRSFSALNGIGMVGAAVGLTINNGAGVSGSVEFTLDRTLESLAYNLGQAIALVEGDTGTYSKSWFPLYSASTMTASMNNCTAYEVGTTGLTVLASTTQAAARSALGCSSMSTQPSTNVTITGGSIDGITIDGGTF